jgi:hypothetical protein
LAYDIENVSLKGKEAIYLYMLIQRFMKDRISDCMKFSKKSEFIIAQRKSQIIPIRK